MKSENETFDDWSNLYRVGGIAAWIVVLIIPIQITLFTIAPPPESPIEFFNLFQENWLLGLLSLDLLYIINNTIIALLYLSLFAALRKTNFTYMLIALVIGLIGISAYYSSTIAFEMLALSDQYQLAKTVELKQQLMAAGYAMLASYKGTSFNVYYVLNAITLLMISRVMFQGRTFTRTTAIWGLVSGILMLIPSTAGQVGLIFSLLSLVPWIVFSILLARTLFNLSNARSVPKSE